MRKKKPNENPVVVKGQVTATHDEIALRKVARAVIAIAKRQLDSDRTNNEASTLAPAKEPDDA